MKLDQRIRRLSDQRAALMNTLEAMPSSDLTARPLADKWSILEIVEHMVLAERAVLQGLPAPSLLTARKRRLKHRFFYLVVLIVLKARIPVRVPSPAMVPRGDRSLSELRSLWDETHAWLEAYLAQLDSGDLRRAVFRHPVTGPLTLAQAMLLDQVHIDLHSRQIRRIQRLLA
jgi:hypothetical protein